MNSTTPHLLTAFICLVCFNCKNQSPIADPFLQSIAKNMNKKCPMQIDAMLTLDSTSVLPENIFRYHFTLRAETGAVDIPAYKRNTKETMINMLQTDAKAAKIRGLRTTVESLYSDSLGGNLFNIVIKPEEYLKGEQTLLR